MKTLRSASHLTLAAFALVVAGCAARRTAPALADGRAEAHARGRAAEAEAERHDAQQVQVATVTRRRELADEENRLERDEDKAELDARPASARRAKEAVERLRPFAAVTEDARSVVLRLEDSVLFERDTAELMPTARERLQLVAEALQEMHARALLVRGYMDRTVDGGRSAELSRRRAEAVRAFLVSQGIQPARVRAEGLGKTSPVTSNASSEGRSENRRIEIVVEGLGGDGAKR